MRLHLILGPALIAGSLCPGFANGAEPSPPTPHAPTPGGTTSEATVRETQPENPGAPHSAPGGPAPTAEPAQATDAPHVENDGALIAADLQLLKRLHEDNEREIEMGKLAQEKGATSQTRSFGRKLVTDHAAAELKIAAFLKRKKLDMSILVAVKTSGPKEQDLGGQSGNDFDHAFFALMVDGHSKVIEDAKERRDKTTDRRLKSLLSALLPPLQRHLRSAQSIAPKSDTKI